MAKGFFSGRGGELIAIDPRGLNDFYADLKSAYAHFVGAAAFVGWWSPESGDGLYTRATSRAAVILTKNVIDGVKNIGTNWAPLSDEQRDSRPGLAVYDRTWKFRGEVYQSIVARKRGKGYEVGVDRRKMVVPTGFSALANTAKYANKIPVERYASWVEYGTQWMPARPLFGPVNIYMAGKMGQFTQVIVSRSIHRIADNFKIEKTASKYSTETVASGMSDYSMNSADPNRDFNSEIMSALLGSASIPGSNSGVNITKHVGSSGLSQIKKESINTLKEVDSWLKSTVGPSELITSAEDWFKDNPNWDKGI